MQRELDEATAEHDNTVSEYNDKVQGLVSKNKALEVERDRLSQERLDLLEQLKAAKAQGGEVNSKVALAEEALGQAKAEQDRIKATAKKSIQMKDKRLDDMSSQVTQTKHLLESANKARKQLQLELEELRAELHSHHTSAIGA